MEETKIIKDVDRGAAVEFDPRKLESLRREIISNLAVVDHFETRSTEPSYYSPQNANMENRKDIQIKNFRESYEPWTDVWELYISSYNRVLIPYLARLLGELLDGDCKAAYSIMGASAGDEYIPIRETIEEYAKLIAEYKAYHDKFPLSSLGYGAEARRAENFIQKHINILLDWEYKNKFRPYYKAAKEMISIRKLEVDEVVEEKPATLRRNKKGTNNKRIN